MSFFSKIKHVLGFEDPRYAELEAWLGEEQKKFESGHEVSPPWVAFPESDPIIGWNQGITYEWSLLVWTPFWHGLTDEQQEDYLTRWPPPNEDWRETLLIYWNKKEEGQT